jgi:hypothetical protein
MDLGLGRRAQWLAATAALIAAVFASLALAAAASAEVRSGTATDPPSSLLPAGQDIVAVSAAYDTATGTITATVTTRGAPEPLPTRALRTDFFPVDGAGDCVAPEARLASIYSEPGAVWLYNGSIIQAGVKSVVGSTTTLTATSPLLVNQPFLCMNAYVLDEEGEPFEYLIPPLRLAGPPPPPAPPAPPPSTPPAPPPAPPAPKLAKLSLGSSETITLRRNQWKQVKLAVTNGGTATAAKVSLKIGGAKGVAIKPKSGKLELKSIAPGKSRTASFKVMLTKKAKPTSSLTLAISGAKGIKASGTLTVKAWKKPGGKKGPEEPTAGRASLAEKIFYTYDSTDTTHSAYLTGYTFIDDTWAYNGIPSGGLPHCTEVTGTSKKEGCVKYSYEPKTGAVQLGSVTGAKITTDGKFEIDGETYLPLWIPPAGARYQVDQYFIGFSGLCGMITGCSTWHEYVTLTSGGEFSYTSQSTTTSGGPGPGETFIAVGSYPPDEHGTYTVEKGGRIKLAFADGHTEVKTFAIFLNKEGNSDVVKEGFIFDTTYFTFASTD